MKLRSLDLVWLALLAATAFTWWLGSGGEPGLGRAAMAAVVLGLAWLKGLGVLLEFMALRHAPRGWRWALVGGFSLIVALVLLATLLAENQ